MYVRSDLAYNPREDLQNENLEDIWLEILLPKTKPILIGTCYRAPKNSNLKESLENTITKLPVDCDTIILGDFNYCLLKNKQNKMTKVLETNGFTQLIKTPTRVTNNSSTLIDHIYVNETRKISQSGVLESGISDHFITYCTRKTLRGQIGKHSTVKIRPMKDYSKESFVELLESYNWDLVYQIRDNVDEAWEKFYTMFTQALNDTVPEKEIRIKGRTEPWIDAEVLELMQERDRALYNANHNKSDSNLRSTYKRLRNKVIKQTRKIKSKHFCEKIEENKDNPKLLWRQLNTIGYSNKSKEKSKIVLEIDGEKCFDSKILANKMGDYFLTVAEKLKSKIPNLPKVFDTGSESFKEYYIAKGVVPKSQKIFRVSEEFVYKELCELNISKATGIDGFKPKFLKDGADVIKGPVTHIINLSLESGVVPNGLKSAIVKPLYKKGSRLDVGNYRPVSILPSISKIMERAVYLQMEKHLKDKNILYEFQSGFRASYSTDTCLINLQDGIRIDISQGKYVGMVLMDLQKAFDTVDHDILLEKLDSMGFDNHKWFESYLKGRKQMVVANDVSSETGTVTCGVPQGSILGPLLFLCYVNDMPISVKCKLLLYADDSALIISGFDPEKIAEELSRELESCRQWLIDNKLSLHLGKTEAILFGSKRKLKRVNSFAVKCGDIKIANVNRVKYLGLQIDNDLSGTSVIEEIINKCNTRLKFLYRYKDILNLQMRKTLCTALVQCSFDYSCCSWYPGLNETFKKKLQVMQNKMIRFILRKENTSSIRNNEFVSAGFFKVSNRVKQLLLGHAFKIRNNLCPNYLTENIVKLNENSDRSETRSKAFNFQVPRISSNTFAFNAIKEWNNLSNSIKNIKGTQAFKDKVKEFLKTSAEDFENNPFMYY